MTVAVAVNTWFPLASRLIVGVNGPGSGKYGSPLIWKLPVIGGVLYELFATAVTVTLCPTSIVVELNCSVIVVGLTTGTIITFVSAA